MSADVVSEYLADCRELVLDELRRIVPRATSAQPVLYDLIFDYPLRASKALRPALCIATCRALGGALESVITSATVIELYHNAFLIHDDVEDGSELRRDGPTLHRAHGVPVAVNVGDAMLALALQPLLDNMKLLSLGKALRIMRTIARMVRESAEGQAIELAWTRNAQWVATDRDYVRMVHKKTSHYTFVTPMVVGGIIGEASLEQIYQLRLFATALGVAFQIQDDLLNLTSSEAILGKEIDGDLWEGKHTLMLIHAVRACSVADRERALAILSKPRPRDRAESAQLEQLLDRLVQSGELSDTGHKTLRASIHGAHSAFRSKTADDVMFLRSLIIEHGGLQYARAVGRRWSARALGSLRAMAWLPPSIHRSFLESVTQFVVERSH
jgi:geranylgeranyl diphosphate synthase type II